MTVVAVDAGRSDCRAAVLIGAGPPAPDQVTRVPSQATLVDPGGPELVAGSVRAVLAGLRGRAGPAGPGPGGLAAAAVLVVAAAGCRSRPAAAAALADLLAAGQPELPGKVARVVVTSDVVAAHAGAFAGTPGVVLAVGTGAVALAVDPGGRHALVDGGGHLIGDAGSGFAIGRAGLAAALRHADGRPGGSAALAAAAVEQYAPGATMREVVAALHQGEPGRQVAGVAGFTPAVAAAARAGDPVARQVWRAAAGELAATVAAAGAVLPNGAGPVALVGRLLAAVEDLLVVPLRGAIAATGGTVTLRAGAGDVLAGAARLGREPAGGYEPLLLVRPVRRPARPAGRGGAAAPQSGSVRSQGGTTDEKQP